jgi:hypothetical protein
MEDSKFKSTAVSPGYENAELVHRNDCTLDVKRTAAGVTLEGKDKTVR